MGLGTVIGKIFGMEKVIDKGAEMIDEAYQTEQEKTEARQKWFETWMDLQRVIANESLPTAVARRVLAFMIMGVFLSLVLLGVALYKIDSVWSAMIFEQAVGRLEVLAGAVGATYFIKDLVVKALREKKE